MQVVDANGNVFGQGLEITGIDGKPKVPVINTDITIGTTAIIGGVVGRILFEGTGNVVQESLSFTYDDTLKKFTLTGPIGSVIQHTALTNYNGLGGLQLNVADGTERAFFKLNPSSGEIRIGGSGSGYFPTFYAQGVEAMRIFASTRNIGINTTTDAGYKFDINGSLRVNSSFSITSPSFAGAFSFTMNAANTLIASSSNIGTWLQVGGGNRVFIVGQEFNSTSRGNIFGNTVGGEAVGIANIIAQSSGTTALTGLNIRYAINNTGTYSGIVRGIYYNPTLTSLTGTTHRAIETVTGDVLFATTSGSLLVGTSTLAGFKADINGTLRATGVITGYQFNSSYNGGSYSSTGVNVLDYGDGLRIGYSSSVQKITLFTAAGTARFQVVNSGSILIGTTTEIASSLLTLTSSTRGFLPPRMTNTEMLAIATPAAGLIVYDTTNNKHYGYDGTTWNPFY